LHPTIENFLRHGVAPREKTCESVVARLISGGIGFTWVPFPIIVGIEIHGPVSEGFLVRILEGIVVTVVPELAAKFAGAVKMAIRGGIP
jgi:hypothetical protein